MDAAGELVQIVAGPAQQAHQLLQLRQIQLEHIAVYRHLAQVCAEIVRPELGHFLPDQLHLLG